jgi:lipoprotein NlpD
MLSDSTRILPGQLIFIPGANQNLRVKRSFISNLESDDFIWPVEGKVLDRFGSLSGGIRNKGIIISASLGTNVLAASSGKVVFSGLLEGYGNTIILEHDDDFSTVYGYNHENLVRIGEFVGQGEVIARVGHAPRTGCSCLYFEIRKAHRPQNPFYYLP